MEHVELLLGYDNPEEILDLFSEYTTMLVQNDPSFQAYLDIQHYDAEIRDLTVKYGLPDGRLYLVRIDGQAAACIALRKLDQERCELKRLYVRPAYRKQGLASMLVNRIIVDARELGYRHLLLDTLPFLQVAIRMYRNLGFYDIPCYNDSPLDHTIYLQLDL